jgi:N12 class adenine-specific DNA methylase
MLTLDPVSLAPPPSGPEIAREEQLLISEGRALAAETEKFKSIRDAIEAKVPGLKARKAALDTELAAIQAEVGNRDTRARTSVSVLNAETAEIEREDAALERAISAFNSAATAGQMDAAQFSAAKTALDQRIASLRARADSHAAAVDAHNRSEQSDPLMARIAAYQKAERDLIAALDAQAAPGFSANTAALQAKWADYENRATAFKKKVDPKQQGQVYNPGIGWTLFGELGLAAPVAGAVGAAGGIVRALSTVAEAVMPESAEARMQREALKAMEGLSFDERMARMAYLRQSSPDHVLLKKPDELHVDPLTGILKERAGLMEAATEQLRGGDFGGGGFNVDRSKLTGTESAVLSGLESIGSNAPGLVAGAMAQTPKLGAAIASTLMGLSTGGQSAGEGRKAGFSPGKALLYGGIDGLVETFTEYIPSHIMMDYLAKKNPSFLRMLYESSIAEQPSEVAATGLQELNRWLFNPDHNNESFKDFLLRMPEAERQTIIATTVATVGQTGMIHALKRMGESPDAANDLAARGLAREKIDEFLAAIRGLRSSDAGTPPATEPSSAGVVTPEPPSPTPSPATPSVALPPSPPRIFQIGGNQVVGTFRDNVVYADGRVISMARRPSYMHALRQYDIPQMTHEQVQALQESQKPPLPPAQVSAPSAPPPMPVRPDANSSRQELPPRPAGITGHVHIPSMNRDVPVSEVAGVSRGVEDVATMGSKVIMADGATWPISRSVLDSLVAAGAADVTRVPPQFGSYEEAQAAIDRFEDALDLKYVDVRHPDGRSVSASLIATSPYASPITAADTAELLALYEARDAFSREETARDVTDIDRRFEALIPDTAERASFVRSVAQADLPISIRNNSDVRGVGGLANMIVHRLSEQYGDHPATAFTIESSNEGTPGSPGMRLRLIHEPGLGPSRPVLNEAQRWMKHLYPEETPIIPGARIAPETPGLPERPSETTLPPSADDAGVIIGAPAPDTGEFEVKARGETQAEAHAVAMEALRKSGKDPDRYSMDPAVWKKGAVRPSRGGVEIDANPEYTFTFTPIPPPVTAEDIKRIPADIEATGLKNLEERSDEEIAEAMDDAEALSRAQALGYARKLLKDGVGVVPKTLAESYGITLAAASEVIAEARKEAGLPKAGAVPDAPKASPQDTPGYRIEPLPDGRFDIIRPNGKRSSMGPFASKEEAAAEMAVMEEANPQKAPAPLKSPAVKSSKAPAPPAKAKTPAIKPLPPQPSAQLSDADAMREGIASGKLSAEDEDALSVDFSSPPRGEGAGDMMGGFPVVPTPERPFITKRTPHGPRVWADAAAIELIIEYAKPEERDAGSKTSALTVRNVDPGAVQWMSEEMAEAQRFGDEERVRRLAGLRDVFAEAVADGRSQVAIVPMNSNAANIGGPMSSRLGLGRQRAAQLARHEMVHQVLGGILNGADYTALDEVPAIRSGYPGLAKKADGYYRAVHGTTRRNLVTRVEEIFTHILAGQEREIRLTEDQAVAIISDAWDKLKAIKGGAAAAKVFRVGNPRITGKVGGYVKEVFGRGGPQSVGDSIHGAGRGGQGGVEGLPPKPEGTGGLDIDRSESPPETGDKRLSTLAPGVRTPVIKTAGVIYRNTESRDEWAAQMLAKIGEKVRPYLNSLYDLAEDVAETHGLPQHRQQEVTDVRTGIAGKPGEAAHSGLPAASGQAAGGEGNAGEDSQSSGEVRAGNLPGQPEAVAGGGSGGVDVRGTVSDPGRKGSSGVGAPRTTNDGFYRITEADHLGEGGPREKLVRNLTAIRTLKSLDSEGRLPTPAEKRILAGYVGWGSLAQAVFSEKNAKLPERLELERLLTPEELDAARKSTMNAHYTSPQVINFMWQMAGRLGFSGGTILEPGMGTGNFFGLAPASVLPNSTFLGVELDQITGKIAQYLYPGAQIMVRGYETVVMPDGAVDLAIGNVPFGNYKLSDPRYRSQNLSIHDYYFVKTLDKARPGGIVMFITSRFTMDKMSPRVRDAMASRGNLVAAYRLPNTAFRQNAGTEVTTDIIILQKRQPQTPQSGEAFSSVTEIAPGLAINEYFARHPENMFGRMALTGKMYGKREEGEPTLEPTEPLDTMMANAMRRAPRNVIDAIQSAPPMIAAAAPGDVRELAYTVQDGRLLQRVDGALVAPLDKKLETEPYLSQMRDLVQIRDQVQSLITLQRTVDDDAMLAGPQGLLNETYDAYVKKYDYLNGRRSRIFEDDPQYPLLLSLENVNPEDKSVTKADIFTKRTIPASMPLTAVSSDMAEALSQVIAERGFPDLEFLASLAHRPVEEVTAELVDKELVFLDPSTGKYDAASTYLSGRVREKLAVAKAAAQQDSAYQPNVAALEKVQPEDRLPQEISYSLGESWIPEDAYKQFIAERLMGAEPGGEAPYEVTVSKLPNSWLVKFPATGAQQLEWSVPQIRLSELVEIGMDLKRPTIWIKHSDGSRSIDQQQTIIAREKLLQIRNAFEEWARTSPVWSGRLARLFNETYNATRLPSFDGSHMPLHGISKEVTPYPHQKDFAWRVVMERRAIAAHEVGTGKTISTIISAMELKRMGIAKKPMIVSPNGRVRQWASEFARTYPGANVLIIGPEDLAGPRRRLMSARIATGNWDAVIMQHSSFGLLPMSPQYVANTIREEIAQLRDAIKSAQESEAAAGGGKSSRTVKQLEKSAAAMETKLRELLEKPKDNTIKFDELGVDFIFVDEAHLFKGLPAYTKLGNVSGLGGRKGSGRAADMKTKIDFVRSRREDGGGVVFMTGTPITNSTVEIYTMTRFVAPDVLRDLGINSFDDWAAHFGNVVDVLEMSHDARSYRPKTKFRLIVSTSKELSDMFRIFTDLKYADELGIKRPRVYGGGPEAIIVPSNGVTEPLIQDIVERIDDLRRNPTKQFEKGADNHLKLNTEGRLVALDPRLLNPSLPDHPESKTNIAVSRIFKVWERNKEKRLTQLVFSQGYRLVNHATKQEIFNLYEDMKKKLMAKGVPASDIAFASDYAGNESQELYDAVNAGDIRIVFGTTEKIGVGANLQRLMLYLHNLDPTYRPDQLAQRIGRILRQGNQNEEIHILNYGLEGSLDAYIYQMMESKEREIRLLLSKGEMPSDGDPFGEFVVQLGQMKALISGNTDIIRQMELQADIMKVEAVRRDKASRVNALRFEESKIQANLESLHKQIPIVSQVIAGYDEYKAAVKKADDPANFFKAQVGGREFGARGELVKFIEAAPEEAFGSPALLFGIPVRFDQVGKWRGGDAQSVGELKHSPHDAAFSVSDFGRISEYSNALKAVNEIADKIRSGELSGPQEVVLPDGRKVTIERVQAYRYHLANEWHDVPQTASGFLTSIVTQLNNALPKEAEKLDRELEGKNKELEDVHSQQASLNDQAENVKLASMQRELSEIMDRLNPRGRPEDAVIDPDAVEASDEEGEDEEAPAAKPKPSLKIDRNEDSFTPSPLPQPPPPFGQDRKYAILRAGTGSEEMDNRGAQMEEAAALRASIDAAYESGNTAEAERLEQRLGAIEEGLEPESDLEIDAVMDGVSSEEQLAGLYARLGHPGADRPQIAAQMRAVIEDGANNESGFVGSPYAPSAPRTDLTDAEIMDAAKDAYESRRAIHGKLKKAPGGALQRAKEWIASRGGPQGPPPPLGSRPREGERGSFSMKPRPKTDAEVALEKADEIKEKNPLIGQILGATAGQSKPSIMERIRASMDRHAKDWVWEYSTSKFPQVQEWLARIIDIVPNAMKQATASVDQILGPEVAREDSELARQIIVLEDAIETAMRLGPDKLPNHYLGLTVDNVQDYLDEIQKLATPEAKAIVERFHVTMEASFGDLVQRGKLDEASKKQKYFPNVVLDYLNTLDQDAYVSAVLHTPGGLQGMQDPPEAPGLKEKEHTLRTSVPSRLKEPFRGYTLERKGHGEKFHSADVWDVTWRYLTKLNADNHVDDLKDSAIKQFENTTLDPASGRMRKLSGAERAAILASTGGRVKPDATYSDQSGNRYYGYQVKPGSRMYRAMVTREANWEAAVIAGLTAAELEQIGTAAEGLAVGRKNPAVLLPMELAKRLISFHERPDIGEIVKWAVRATSKWKAITLTNAGLTYQTNNLLGDSLHALSWEPATVLKMYPALKLLWKDRMRTADSILAKLTRASLKRMGIADIELTNAEKDMIKMMEDAKVLHASATSFFDQFGGNARLDDSEIYRRTMKTGWEKTKLQGKKVLADLWNHMGMRTIGEYREALPRVAMWMAMNDHMEKSRASFRKKFVADYKRANKGIPPGAKIVRKAESSKNFLRPWQKTFGLTNEQARDAAPRDILINYSKKTWRFSTYISGLALPFATYNLKIVGSVLRQAKSPYFWAIQGGLLTAAWLWNNMYYPDDERDAPEWMKYKLHVWLPANDVDPKTGRTTRKALVGNWLPLNIAGTWVGLDKWSSYLGEIYRGDSDTKKIAGNVIEDWTGYNPVSGTGIVAVNSAWAKTAAAMVGPLVAAFEGLVYNRRGATGRPVVPERLKNTPRGDAMAYSYVIERMLAPVTQGVTAYEAVMQEAPEEDEDLDDVSNPLAHATAGAKWGSSILGAYLFDRGPLDPWKAIGGHEIDVQRERQAKWRNELRAQENMHNAKLLDIQDLYVKFEGGRQYTEEQFSGEMEKIQEGDGPYVPTQTVWRLLRSPQTRIRVAQAQFRGTSDPEKKRQLSETINALDNQILAESRKGAPRAVRPELPPIPFSDTAAPSGVPPGSYSAPRGFPPRPPSFQPQP